MITAFTDALDALFNLQRALDASLTSDWLGHTTTSRGPYPRLPRFFRHGTAVALMSPAAEQ